MTVDRLRGALSGARSISGEIVEPSGFSRALSAPTDPGGVGSVMSQVNREDRPDDSRLESPLSLKIFG